MGIKSRTRGIHRQVRISVIGGLTATGMLALPIGASSASSKSCTSSVGTKITDKAICKGLAFYKGQQLMFITGTSGGGTDLTARALAPLLDEYLGATINVSDQGQANGIPGQNALVSAAPTGLEIGFVNAGSIASLMLTKQTGFNFNPGRLAYIAGEIATPSVLVSSPASGLSTFSQFKAATTTSSSTKLLGEFPSAGNSELEVLLNMLGMHVTWVTGYPNTSAVATGFYRGDGPVANDTFANLSGLIQGKSAVSMATSVPLSVGMPLRGLLVNTPSYSSLLKTYAPKKPTKDWKDAAIAEGDFVRLGQPLVTQTKVAGYKVQALRAAAQWAFAQYSFKQADLAAGDNPTYVNPVTAKMDFNTVIKAGVALAKYLPQTTP